MTDAPTQPCIRPATAADLPQVLTLLAAVGLPEAGLASHVETLLVAEEDGGVVGCAALETHGEDALLRSVAVAPTHRGRGLGDRLIEAALDLAGGRGIGRVYLLTTDADVYFAARGFVSIDRDAAPPAIRASEEFASACPSSARLMARSMNSASGGRGWTRDKLYEERTRRRQ